MQPLTLEEFAQNLRVRGDWREAEFADEILTLVDLETDVAEPYWELVSDLEYSAPDDLKDKPAKSLERLNDRSALLAEIEKLLSDAGLDVGANGLPIDADDAVRDLIANLPDLPEPLEYDL